LRPQLEEHLTSEPRAFNRDEPRRFNRDLMGRRLRPIDDETVALIHPIFTQPTFGQRGQREWIEAPPPPGFVIVTISLPEIQQEIFPALARRHFSGVASVDGFDYSAAVVTQEPEQKIIYQFGPEAAYKTEADVTVGLMGPRWEMLRQMI